MKNTFFKVGMIYDNRGVKIENAYIVEAKDLTQAKEKILHHFHAINSAIARTIKWDFAEEIDFNIPFCYFVDYLDNKEI